MVIGLNKRSCICVLLILILSIVFSVSVSGGSQNTYIGLLYQDEELNLTNQHWKAIWKMSDTTYKSWTPCVICQELPGARSNPGKFRITKSGTYDVWTQVVSDAWGQCRTGGRTLQIDLRQTHALQIDKRGPVEVVPRSSAGDYHYVWTKAYDDINLAAGEHTVTLIDTGGRQDPCGVTLIYPTYANRLLITDENVDSYDDFTFWLPTGGSVFDTERNPAACDAYYTCIDNRSCWGYSYFTPGPAASNVATSGYCCGDDPGEKLAKIVHGASTYYKCLMDEPDSSQNVCEAVYGVNEWWNPDQNIGTIDDNCCGDDDFDNGIISKESAAGGVYLMCDRTEPAPGSATVRQATSVYAGSVYRILRSAAEDYDVLATDTGKFIPCDPANKITRAYYTPAGLFSDYPRCTAPSYDRCIRTAGSEFLCNLKPGDRNRIYECRSAMPSGGRYSASPAQEANANDDNQGFVLGKGIPNPLPEDWSGFSRKSLTPCNAEFCLSFTTPAQDQIATNKFKNISWENFNFVFDIYLDRPEKAEDIELLLSGTNKAGGQAPALQASISDYFTSSRKQGTGRWYHVIIPEDEIPFDNIPLSFGLIPRSANIGRVGISNPHLESKSPLPKYSAYFCGEDAEYRTGMWIRDPDDNAKACNALLTADWTGSRCCGDDWSVRNKGYQDAWQGEFFFDTDAMCFNSWKVPETGTVQRIPASDDQENMKYKFLADSDTMKVYLCGADEAGFAGLADIKITHGNDTGQPMVEEAEVCDAFGTRSRSYFCNGSEWSDATYTISDPDNFPGTIRPLERTVPSRDPTGTKIGCCRQDECFDGTTCVDSQHDDQPETPTGGGTMCIRGHWVNASIVYDWLNDEFGFCGNSSQCLLDPDADPLITSDETLSVCKPSGWYAQSSVIPELGKSLGYHDNKINALYCDSGEWTSRTRFIAQKLLAVPATDDYTLACGYPSDVLVDNGFGFRAYDPEASAAMQFTNEYDEDIFNHLCIMQYKDDLIVGASFNKFGDDIGIPIANQISIEKALYEAFDIKYIDLSSCTGSTDTYDFKQCVMQSDSATNPRFYWNEMTQSFIYTPDGGDVLGTGFVSSLYNLFITPILDMLGVVKRNIFEVAPTPLKDTTLFSRLYVRKLGDRRIHAITEPKKGKGTTIYDYLSVTYENFPEDICATVDVYDVERAKQAIMCEKDGNRQTVFAVAGSNNPAALLAPRDFVQSITQQRRLS